MHSYMMNERDKNVKPQSLNFHGVNQLKSHVVQAGYQLIGVIGLLGHGV